MNDLIPSLAFTALLELHPTYRYTETQDPAGIELLRSLTAAMRQAAEQRHRDLWLFAKGWIEVRLAPHHERDGYGCLTAPDATFPPLTDDPGTAHTCGCGRRWEIREIAGFIVWQPREENP